MTKKYFGVRTIIMTVFIIVTFAAFAVSCDKNSSETENSNTTTTTTTQVTTTTSDKEDVTTTTIATTATNAQTTTTTTKATTTTTAQTTTVTTTEEEQNPPTVTTSYALPDTAIYVDIDIVVDDNNNAAVAVMFLQSHGVNTTVQEIAPYVTGCTNEETFADGITTFLNSKVIQKRVEIVISNELASAVGGAYSGNIVHMFYFNGNPIVVYAADESDMSVYTIENGNLVKDTADGFMSKYGGRYVTIF